MKLIDSLTSTQLQCIEHIQFIKQADLTYQIILSTDGRIMDGMHRVAKENYREIWRFSLYNSRKRLRLILSTLMRMT